MGHVAIKLRTVTLHPQVPVYTMRAARLSTLSIYSIRSLFIRLLLKLKAPGGIYLSHTISTRYCSSIHLFVSHSLFSVSKSKAPCTHVFSSRFSPKTRVTRQAHTRPPPVYPDAPPIQQQHLPEDLPHPQCNTLCPLTVQPPCQPPMHTMQYAQLRYHPTSPASDPTSPTSLPTSTSPLDLPRSNLPNMPTRPNLQPSSSRPQPRPFARAFRAACLLRGTHTPPRPPPAARRGQKLAQLCPASFVDTRRHDTR